MNHWWCPAAILLYHRCLHDDKVAGVSVIHGRAAWSMAGQWDPRHGRAAWSTAGQASMIHGTAGQLDPWHGRARDPRHGKTAWSTAGQRDPWQASEIHGTAGQRDPQQGTRSTARQGSMIHGRAGQLDPRHGSVIHGRAGQLDPRQASVIHGTAGQLDPRHGRAAWCKTQQGTRSTARQGSVVHGRQLDPRQGAAWSTAGQRDSAIQFSGTSAWVARRTYGTSPAVYLLTRIIFSHLCQFNW